MNTLLKVCIWTSVFRLLCANTIQIACTNQTLLYSKTEPVSEASVQSFSRRVHAHVEWKFESMQEDIYVLASLIPGFYEDVHSHTEVSWTTFLTLSTIVSYETTLSQDKIEFLFLNHSRANAVHARTALHVGSLATLTLESTKLSCAEMWPNVASLDDLNILVHGDNMWARIQVFNAHCASDINVTHPTLDCEQERFNFQHLTSATVTTRHEICTPTRNVSLHTSFVTNAWSVNCTRVRLQGLYLQKSSWVTNNLFQTGKSRSVQALRGIFDERGLSTFEIFLLYRLAPGMNRETVALFQQINTINLDGLLQRLHSTFAHLCI